MRNSGPEEPKATSATPLLVQIEKPVYGGACLARVEGKAVFVPLTLPGEQARVRIVEEKCGYAQAEVEEIVAPSPQRIASQCRHFGTCGGCSYQHTDYTTQLAMKQAILRETLERAGVKAPEEIDALTGEPWAYRNRIRLAVDAAGRLGYRGPRSHAVVPIAECPIAAPVLVRAALAWSEALRASAPTLRPTEIALFCNADESAVPASIFVARPTTVPLETIGKAWKERVPVLAGVELVMEGRDRQPAKALARWGADSLSYRAAGFDYRVDHGAFFQVNRWLVDALVERVTAGRKGKAAWDLFAGVGLFARKLAANFERVLAVESAPAALPCIKANLHGTAGEAVRADTLQFLRQRTKSKAGGPDLVVVDPPRTGLGKEVVQLLADVAAPAMVYVSCDPATLARDLRGLTSSGYAIESVTLVDLFPQTFHLETVVALHRS